VTRSGVNAQRWWGKGHGGVASAVWEGVWLLGCVSPQIRGIGAPWLRFGASKGKVEVECKRGVNEEKWPPPLMQENLHLLAIDGNKQPGPIA